MELSIKKDGDGYLAELLNHDNIFAYGETPEKAKENLLGVVEMMMDYHLELVEKDRKIKNTILSQKDIAYAL